MHGSPTYKTWQNNTHKNWWSDPGLRFNSLCCAVLFLGVVVNGYDGSYLTGLQALSTWQTYFNHPKGYTLGLISAAAYFPNFVTPPVLSWMCDKYGRKPTLMFGGFFIIAGGLVCGFAQNRNMLLGGRLVVGFGNIFLVVSSICLTQELTHPRLRGITTALLHTLYYGGSIFAAILTFIFTYVESKPSVGNWAWRVPAILQGFAPLVLVCCMIFVPESPRFMISKGRHDEAHALLARLHANGKMDDELVVNEFEEMKAAITLEQSVNTGWSSLFATPGNRRRMLVVAIVATGTQLMGQSILSYYLAPVLRSVGLTNPRQITGFNVGLSAFNWIVATAGACIVDSVGRRKIWLWGTFTFFLGYVGFMATSAVYATKGSHGAGYGALFFVFIIFGAYNAAWNPLSYSYTAEILPYSIRAKGVSVFTFLQSVSLAFNQFVNPIALEAIAWKYYGVFLVVSAAYCVLIYFFFVETKGYTAEEVGALFDKGTSADHSDAITGAALEGKSNQGSTELREKA